MQSRSEGEHVELLGGVAELDDGSTDQEQELRISVEDLDDKLGWGA